MYYLTPAGGSFVYPVDVRYIFPIKGSDLRRNILGIIVILMTWYH